MDKVLFVGPIEPATYFLTLHPDSDMNSSTAWLATFAASKFNSYA